MGSYNLKSYLKACLFLAPEWLNLYLISLFAVIAKKVKFGNWSRLKPVTEKLSF